MFYPRAKTSGCLGKSGWFLNLPSAVVCGEIFSNIRVMRQTEVTAVYRLVMLRHVKWVLISSYSFMLGQDGAKLKYQT